MGTQPASSPWPQEAIRAPKTQTLVEQKLWFLIPKELEVPFKSCIQAPDVALADAQEVVLHLGPVIGGDARRDGGIGHQVVDASLFQDVWCILLQGLMVPHHAVLYLAGCAQLHVGHPVNDAVPELEVQPPVVRIAQVAYEIFELDAPGLCPVLPVLFDDARGNLMPVPRFESWIVDKFILKGRYESFKGVSDNKKLEVCFKSKGEKKSKRDREISLTPSLSGEGEKRIIAAASPAGPALPSPRPSPPLTQPPPAQPSPGPSPIASAL